MKTITVKKGKFGMMYRTSFNTSWLYFSDGIETREQMLNFFTRDGQDTPQLVYVNDTDKTAKYYKLLKKDFGKVTLKVDGEKILQLEQDQFLTVSEQIDILRVHSDRSTDQEAQELTDEREVLKLYKSRADVQALDSLHMKIESSISEERIKELCQEHAKQYFDLPATVEL